MRACCKISVLILSLWFSRLPVAPAILGITMSETIFPLIPSMTRDTLAISERQPSFVIAPKDE